MLRKTCLLSLAIAMTISVNSVFADTVIQQIQSPIYTDDIGRSHFLGKGGYSSVRKLDMGAAYNGAINEAANDIRKTEKEVRENLDSVKNSVETDITTVIKERTDVPVSAKTKASFTSEERKMDPSASFGHGGTYLPSSGVNKSKTMYTDEIGRLHFFGKGNLIKE